MALTSSSPAMPRGSLFPLLRGLPRKNCPLGAGSHKPCPVRAESRSAKIFVLSEIDAILQQLTVRSIKKSPTKQSLSGAPRDLWGIPRDELKSGRPYDENICVR